MFQVLYQCGAYTIHEKGHVCRMNHYKKIDETLNWDSVNFPSSNIDIDIFEENNQGLSSFNVFFLQK